MGFCHIWVGGKSKCLLSHLGQRQHYLSKTRPTHIQMIRRKEASKPKKSTESLNEKYLKIKMKRTSNPKNTVTLSMVRSITTNWYRNAGINLTSFKIRRSRNVRSTDKPPFPSWNNSNTLKQKELRVNFFETLKKFDLEFEKVKAAQWYFVVSGVWISEPRSKYFYRSKRKLCQKWRFLETENSFAKNRAFSMSLKVIVSKKRLFLVKGDNYMCPHNKILQVQTFQQNFAKGFDKSWGILPESDNAAVKKIKSIR